MSQSVYRQANPNRIERTSLTDANENLHSMSNGASSSFQSFVDDIPFVFNPKYRTIIVPDVDIVEYDTAKMRSVLDAQINFNLENQVLREALEDLQRRKKEIQADNSSTQVNRAPVTMPNNSSSTNAGTMPSNIPSETTPFPVNVVHWAASSFPRHPSASSHLSSSVTSDPSLPVSSSFPLSPTSHSNNPSTLPSYRLPSVRDIYWPSADHHHHLSPMPAVSGTSNLLHLPTPIHSSQSSPVSVKQNNRSLNNCDSAAVRDLAATFDERLTSDDPFHDAELRSLNDAAELRHLYSTSGPAHTIQR